MGTDRQAHTHTHTDTSIPWLGLFHFFNFSSLPSDLAFWDREFFVLGVVWVFVFSILFLGLLGVHSGTCTDAGMMCIAVSHFLYGGHFALCLPVAFRSSLYFGFSLRRTGNRFVFWAEHTWFTAHWVDVPHSWLLIDFTIQCLVQSDFRLKWVAHFTLPNAHCFLHFLCWWQISCVLLGSVF